MSDRFVFLEFPAHSLPELIRYKRQRSYIYLYGSKRTLSLEKEGQKKERHKVEERRGYSCNTSRPVFTLKRSVSSPFLIRINDNSRQLLSLLHPDYRKNYELYIFNGSLIETLVVDKLSSLTTMIDKDRDRVSHVNTKKKNTKKNTKKVLI